MRRETPTEWLPLLGAKRLHSLRDLAVAIGISPQTATRLVHGEHTSRQTIEAAAELLGVTPERIRELRHEAPVLAFRLPPEADQLGTRQRAAIVEVIRAMLELTDATAIVPETVPEAVMSMEAEADQIAQANGPKRRRTVRP